MKSYICTVQETEMEPAFPVGSWIICDDVESIEPGNAYVIGTSLEAGCWRLCRIESANDEELTVTFDATDERLTLRRSDFPIVLLVFGVNRKVDADRPGGDPIRRAGEAAA